MEKLKKFSVTRNIGTVLDGAFATQVYDTSAEIIDIAGADISSLNEDGVLNSEHVNPDNKQFRESTKEEAGQWGTIVGRIIFAKKIFNENDCESEREHGLWEKLQVPFIYGAAELFDAENHSNAKDLAAIIRHYHRRGLPVVVRYSIEGSTLERNGPHLMATVCRRAAMTIKPCNRSSYNYLVAEAAPPQQVEIQKNEIGYSPYISIFEMEYDPKIDDAFELAKNALEELNDLNKAFTLGSSNVAPGALTGGAALSKEDVDKRNFLKNQVLAALRDWDKTSDFKKFLKHRLPDADDRFVDKFSEIADQLRMSKSELKKKDTIVDDYGQAQALASLDTKVPSGAKVFKDKYVMPGEVELTAGPYQGSKLKLLHVDKTHVYVQPFKATDQNDVKVNKMNRNLEGSHFRVVQPPEELKIPNYVHGDKHTDIGLTESHEQKELVHGIDMASEPLHQTHPHGATEARTKGIIGWFRGSSGKMGYIKPAITTLTRDPLKEGSKEYISTARRETVFHNVAKNFFGLGEHVPTTTTFKHPQSGHEHSVMELIPHAEHVKMNVNEHEPKDRLMQAGDTGQLDKMAMMDVIMGNNDRNRLNYMTSPQHPHVHLIDNSLIFDHQDYYLPAYLHDYHHFKGDSIENSMMHPDSIKWLMSLDPFQLGAELARQGVHEKIANESVARLFSMQSSAVMGQANKIKLLFSHHDYNAHLRPTNG